MTRSLAIPAEWKVVYIDFCIAADSSHEKAFAPVSLCDVEEIVYVIAQHQRLTFSSLESPCNLFNDVWQSGDGFGSVHSRDTHGTSHLATTKETIIQRPLVVAQEIRKFE